MTRQVWRERLLDGAREALGSDQNPARHFGTNGLAEKVGNVARESIDLGVSSSRSVAVIVDPAPRQEASQTARRGSSEEYAEEPPRTPISLGLEELRVSVRADENPDWIRGRLSYRASRHARVLCSKCANRPLAGDCFGPSVQQVALGRADPVRSVRNAPDAIKEVGRMHV